MMEDRWLSVDEIAAYLGIKRDTVYKWIAEKQMPAYRLGRFWKFRKEEIDQWVRGGGAGDAIPPVRMPDYHEGETQLLTRDEILRQLRENADEMQRRFSVRRIGLFGSHVRGSADCGSDIDILVELDEPTFDHFMDLKFFLENLLGQSVDLVLADSVKPRLKPHIAREVVYA
jgi:hypothetical protein